MTRSETTRLVLALGSAQTLAWASSYYLPAILADPVSRELGVSTTMFFAAFSLALVISALIGPLAGRWIDRHGGRGLLTASSLTLAAGLMLLGMATGPVMLFGAWLVLGVGMAIGLYEPAFATLAALYGQGARAPITGITLIAGFASTVGWPVSAALEAAYGWRMACFVWAGLHLTLGLFLNYVFVPPGQRAEILTAAKPEIAPTEGGRTMVLLAIVFGITLFVSTAMAAHLPRLLGLAGASTAAAVAAGALIGPAQVLARVLEFGLLSRFHPLVSARIATLGHPLGAVILMAVGGPAAAVFTVLHGCGNGILTISKGTLPLALFGPAGYGQRQGILSAPGRIAQAGAPLIFGVLIERLGADAYWITAGLGLAAFFILLSIRRTGR